MSHIHHPLQEIPMRRLVRKKRRRSEVKSNHYWACHNDKILPEETDPWIKTRFSVNFPEIFIFYFSQSFLSSLMEHDAITLSRSIIQGQKKGDGDISDHFISTAPHPLPFSFLFPKEQISGLEKSNILQTKFGYFFNITKRHKYNNWDIDGYTFGN